jgi:predicted kinase
VALQLDHDDLDRAFGAYTRRVDDYGLRWWASDAGVEEVLTGDPALLEALAAKAQAGEVVETSDVYLEEDHWRLLRAGTQAQLLSALFPSAEGHIAAPVVVYLMGLPGSGKTSVLRPLALDYLALHERGVVCVRDADEVRVRLPEYAAGLGSHVVQTEASDVTYVQAEHLLSPATHLVIDVVGDPGWVPDEMQHFRDQGFTIVALCAEAPLAIAEERAKRRALSTGRHVSPAYVRSAVGRPRATLDAALAVAALVSHWALVDTADFSRRAIVIDGDGRFGVTGRPASPFGSDERSPAR